MAFPHPFTQDPQTIAMAGDWHGNLDYARRVIEYTQIRDVEGIIQLGDFGVWPGRCGATYLDGLEQMLRKAGMWLLFIDGNHEDFTQLHSLPVDELGTRPVRERLWHVPRGMRWTWHQKSWLALGGATSLDRKYRREGRDWWPEEAITAQQAQQVIDAGPANAMITHDCPAGVDIPDLPPDTTWDPHALVLANAHRRQLATVLEAVQPEHLWHGHFHVRYSIDTLFGGKACRVEGLDADGTALTENLMLVDLWTL